MVCVGNFVRQEAGNWANVLAFVTDVIKLMHQTLELQRALGDTLASRLCVCVHTQLCPNFCDPMLQ